MAGEFDTLVINNSADVLQLNYGGQLPEVTVSSSVNYTMAPGVNNSMSGSFGTVDWNLTGTSNLIANAGQNSGNYNITGNAGSDTITGGTANNNLNAGTGIDTLVGGAVGSTNYFTVTNSADVVVAQSGATNTIFADSSYTLPAIVTQLYVESASIVGTAYTTNDYLEADGGHDTLVGGGGNDTLDSSYGTNTLIGGSGSALFSALAGDTVILNSGYANSQVTVTGGTGTPTIRFGAGVTPGSLTASAALDSSNHAALAISDGTGVVTLDGALSGQAYQFNFNGGGNLTLGQFLAEVNITTSSLAGASGNVILEGNASASVTGGTGNDTIYAAGAADTIQGGSGNQVLDALGANDFIVGGTASDTLSGFGANDTITAGSAVDTLIGGTAASVDFVLNSTSDVVPDTGPALARTRYLPLRVIRFRPT